MTMGSFCGDFMALSRGRRPTTPRYRTSSDLRRKRQNLWVYMIFEDSRRSRV